MNADMMLKALTLLHPDDNAVIEVRTVGKPILSGYFKSKQNCVKCVSEYPNETWYTVMNACNDALYGRVQHECIVSNPKATTSDKEVDSINWILIDVDPERPTGVGATDAEKRYAMSVIKSTHDYLKAEGFPEPVVCDSGNGYHLLYRCMLMPEHKTKVEDFLKVLDLYFSTPEAKIDTSVFNPARITKLYGTRTTKGANTEDRPHRLSRIIRVPEPLQMVSVSQLQKVSDQLPKPEPRTPAQQFFDKRFDVREFMSHNGMTVHHEQGFPGGTKFVLDQCPFDPNHKSPDSAVFLFDDGRIGFKCFHNSCDNRSWKDVRLLYDKTYNTGTQYTSTTYNPVQPVDAVRDPFLDISSVSIITKLNEDRIKSGFTGIDRKILGFNRGELSIWSGGNGSGKSTFLSQLALETVQERHKVAIYSGELTSNRMKNWMYLQAAGRSGVKPVSVPDGIIYTVDKELVPQIDEWLKGNLFLYDNSVGNKLGQVITGFKQLMEKTPIDVLIMDNLMSLDIGSRDDKWDAQTKVVLELSQLAKDCGCHVHFVCHPRKPNGFLRKSDIAGTSDLTNAADNVFMMHRVNQDFMRSVKEFYGNKVQDAMQEYSNVVEIMKNRDRGVQDELIGLYFEPSCKQFMNESNLNRAYAWQDMTMHEVQASDCPF